MSQTIHLGTVLGSRYKVTAHVVTTADQDQVLDARDQLLERRVSVLAAGPDSAERLIHNAREVATGGMGGSVQVLDLGQAENGVTYLIATHTSPENLLDLLLTDNSTLEQESEQQHALGSEIFGSDTAEPQSDYEQVDPDATEVHRPQARRRTEEKKPAVVPWTQADYDAYGEEMPVPRAPGISQDGSLFDRAAYDSSQQVHSPSRESRHSFTEYEEDPDSDDDHHHGFVEGVDYDEYEEDLDDAPEDRRTAGRGRRGSRAPGSSRSRSGGAGLWLTFAVVLALVLALIGFGFTRLGGMVTGFEQSGSPSSGASKGAGGDSPAPEVAEVSRVVPDQPDFMADQDSTLSRTADEDPATAWTSYGFSTPDFGQVVSGFGLAARLKDAAEVQRVALEQQGGTGGQFTVYVNDQPSLAGATKAGSGSFQDGKTTVDLDQEARSKKARYVIVYLTELPQLQQPISGYDYGLRLEELSVS